MSKKMSEVQTRKKIKSELSQDESLNTGMTISHLNDDCLRCILAYLPLKDKLILQRVSKKWQALMPWSIWNGEKQLQISHKNVMLGCEDWMSYSSKSIKKLLALCGKFVTDIEVTDLPTNTTSNELQNMIKMFKTLCPNVVSLDLNGFKLTEPLIQLLIENFAGLKSIGIGECDKRCEIEIGKLFSGKKNLCSIKFMNSNIKGDCLTSLPLETLEEFEVLGTQTLLMHNLYKTCKKMDNLRIFQVTDNLKLIEHMDRLLEHLPNKSKLETLTLHIIDMPDISFVLPDREKIVKMNNVRYLTNLQKLILNGPQVIYDEALTIIGNTCENLKEATIIDSHKLTDAGWQNFAKLVNIEKLQIGELNALTEKCLLSLQASSLKSFYCYQIDLTNASLKFLLDSANSLNLLDVALCPKVNHVTLVKNASAQIERRPKHEVLKLGIDIDDKVRQMKNVSSRLAVKQTNCYLVEVKKSQAQFTDQEAAFVDLIRRHLFG